MLDPADRPIIDDILRVTAARLAPGGIAITPGKTSPAHLTFDSYRRWGGRFEMPEIQRRGGFKWLRAAAVLAHLGIDLDNDGPDGDGRWLHLLASRNDKAGLPGNVATSIGERTASRADIVSDIVRVTGAAGLAPPVRPSFQQYQELGGLHPYQHVLARGGWPDLCAEAGFTTEPAPKPRSVRAPKPPTPSREELRKLVVQDIARVAAKIAAGDLLPASSNGLSKSEYRVAGGHYSQAEINAVQDEEGWPGLCRQAGVKPPAHRMRRLEHKRKVARAKAARAKARMGGQAPVVQSTPPPKRRQQRHVEAAPGGSTPVQPLGPFAMMMSKDPAVRRRRRRTPAMNLRYLLDRDEVLADLRLAARSAGVPVARMALETYLASGGRYSCHDMRDFGGFGRACRAAASLAA